MSTEEEAISGVKALAQEYDLVGERSMEPHYYLVQTEVATHSSKGELKGTEIYREHLVCAPGNRSVREADTFTCAKFSVQREDGPELMQGGQEAIRNHDTRKARTGEARCWMKKH